MKFSISFKYSNASFKNTKTKETVSYETKSTDGNTFTFDNVDEDVVIGILKGLKDKKASGVFSFNDLRTNFINVIARNKCKELYDKIEKESWNIDDIVISNITLKDVEFTKPTMNAREALTVESANLVKGTCEECGEKNVRLYETDNGKWLCRLCADDERRWQDAARRNSKFYKYFAYDNSLDESNDKVQIEPVIFRKTKDGTPIAFFPKTLRDGSCNPGMLMSYEHVGQHGEASIDFYYECKPCSEEEYADLLTELEQIYDDCKLVVKRRI